MFVTPISHNMGVVKRPSRPEVALIVASSTANVRARSRADYICDGTDDDVQIQAALDALPDNGGTVILSEGTFSTGATINMTVAQRLIGQGIEATHVQADAAGFHVIHMGNRQSDSTMRNFMALEEMSVSAGGGANDYDAVWVDGGGNGTHIINVKASEGKYNFRLTDIDQAYFQGIKAFNAREAGIYCEVGLENTWGNVAFYSPAVAISDANKVGWLFSNSAAQASPNRFDRISIYGALFFSTAGLAGTTGLKMVVGATAFTIIGSLFESNIHQIHLLDETQLTLIGDSFIQNSGVSTNLMLFENDNHSVTIQDCRLQQATNAFNGSSGYTKLCFLGRNTNQGNITNMFAGTFGAKQGTDTVFAGDNALASGLDNEKYDYGFFNHIKTTDIYLGGTLLTPSAAEINYVDGVTSDIQTQLNAKAADADVVHDTGNETIAGVKTFSSDPIIPDEAYGVGWNGSLEPATKNAIYDKIETVSGGSGASTALDNLASVAINTSLISDTDSTDNLGSSSKYWANTFTDKLYLNATATLDGATGGLITATGDVKVVGTGTTSATSALKIFKSDGTSWIANFRNNNTVAINAENDPDNWAILYVNGGVRYDDDFRFKKGSGSQYVTRSGGTGYDLVFQCGGDNLVLYGNGGVRMADTGKNIGFYGTTPIAKQTGVAVSAAGIHAALVALGLIAA